MHAFILSCCLKANDDDEDEEKYAEEMLMPGQKFDSKL